MAAGKVARVIRAPGRVIVEPTDLSEIITSSGSDESIASSGAAPAEPGDIVDSPTGFSSGPAIPNYGGIEVGKTRAFAIQPLGRAFRVQSEGLGEASDVLESNNEYVVSFFVRGWDDDAIEQFLGGGYAAGATTRHAVWSEPGSVTPGASASLRAKKVLYVPDDTRHVPAVLVYAGVPDWSDAAELALQRTEEFGLPISLDCLRDSSDRILQVGLLSDLTL